MLYFLTIKKTPVRHGIREVSGADYIRNNRNLKVDNLTNETKEWDKRVKSISKGPTEIIKQIGSFPKTKHPPQTMRVDSWVSAPFLFIFLHGDFYEPKSTGQDVARSFDRTFVFVESAPNSVAAQQGWPVQIVNDQLVVRSYSGRFSYGTEESSNAAPPAPASAAVAVSPPPSSVPTTTLPAPSTSPAAASVLSTLPSATTAQQELLIQQVMQQTGMTYSFSRQCLIENSYDINSALNVFNSVKASLPPEAFMRV